jgi:hypothetical protein
LQFRTSRFFFQIRGVAPRIKKKSLGPFKGWDHPVLSAIPTGFSAILHDIQGIEGKKEEAPVTTFLQRNF